jgi:hypothetical protein
MKKNDREKLSLIKKRFEKRKENIGDSTYFKLGIYITVCRLRMVLILIFIYLKFCSFSFHFLLIFSIYNISNFYSSWNLKL